MKLKQTLAALAGLTLSALVVPSASASYTNFADFFSSDFSLNATAWNPGGTSVRTSGGAATAGGATWSVMGAGLADASGADAHGSSFTTLLTALYAGGVNPVTTIGLALDSWDVVSGFSNLGMVDDGGGGLGASGAAGSVGNLRIGAIFIDGGSGSNVLAHAFNPCNATQCGFGGNVGGDLHFDNSNAWSDGGTAGTIDFHTVALHELGHALGLGHSTAAGSVMEASYEGARRTLTADDIAGIQSLYGVAVAVPEPGTRAMLMLGALGLLAYVRLRSTKSDTRA